MKGKYSRVITVDARTALPAVLSSREVPVPAVKEVRVPPDLITRWKRREMFLSAINLIQFFHPVARHSAVLNVPAVCIANTGGMKVEQNRVTFCEVSVVHCFFTNN